MPITHTTWAKGQSGNPGGRPRILEAVRDIARESTTLAIETLRTIAADTDAPHAARVRAEECARDDRRGVDGDDGKEGGVGGLIIKFIAHQRSITHSRLIRTRRVLVAYQAAKLFKSYRGGPCMCATVAVGA